eukprot:629652-Alexandrium_andersonii.AAC.1
MPTCSQTHARARATRLATTLYAKCARAISHELKGAVAGSLFCSATLITAELRHAVTETC